MSSKPDAALNAAPELFHESTLYGDLSWWPHFSRGLRCKQVALLVLMATPLIALLAWRAAWQPMWVGPLATLAVAATIDCLGRVLIWISGIGNRWLIAVSVASQATGLIAGLSFIVSVTSAGLPIGLIVAGVFQVIAALTFANYLAGVGRDLGDLGTTQKAKRTRSGIFGVLGSLGCFGGMTLIASVAVAGITIFTGGYGFMLGVYVGGLVLFFASVPLLVSVCVMYWNYARVLSQLRTRINAAAKSLVDY